MEKNIVIAIKRYLKTVPNCFFWKEHGEMYGTAGIPDLIICLNGRFVAFEVKTETGVVSKLQEQTINKITAAHGIARVVRSVDEVEEIIKTLRN